MYLFRLSVLPRTELRGRLMVTVTSLAGLVTKTYKMISEYSFITMFM